ncbi:hypothetical protein [Niabella aurantiaca]|uniref:hypothetical protein n=1 Tax=Niabella aurantiaca TaxID=379900 RepID=UPI000378C543|nr:hypothetical protein [Niabella aurantiaca]
MAKKDNIRKVPAKKKAVHKQEKTGGVRFKPGNQAAVKWTDETMIPELNKILAVLGTDDNGLENTNIVRANDIKFAEEAVMCAGVDLRSWDYWNEKEFQSKLPKDGVVLGLIKKIKDICRLRLAYSGEIMDIFLLKNHYGYMDKMVQEVDANVKTENTNTTTVKLDNLSQSTIKELIKLKGVAK